MIEKVSWTCRCGMWHSRQKNDRAAPMLVTCDGIERVRFVIEAMAQQLEWSGRNPEERLAIRSEPATSPPFWAHPEAKNSAHLRVVAVTVAPNQEFRLFCEACGFDSTDVLKTTRREVLMTSTEMLP